jgi:hypothetical protein
VCTVVIHYFSPGPGKSLFHIEKSVILSSLKSLETSVVDPNLNPKVLAGSEFEKKFGSRYCYNLK